MTLTQVLSPMMQDFLETNGLTNYMKEKTCWKAKDGSCIDLILSNKGSLMNYKDLILSNKGSLMNAGAVETNLSDHITY